MIEIPKLSCFDRLKQDNENTKGDSLVRTLVLPFTADIRIKERQVVDDMRRFMSRVTAEFFHDPTQRTSKEFSLYLKFLEIVEGRKELTEFYRVFPKVETMLMLDTVISGRASFTILDEFVKLGREIGKEIVPLLVVDNNGRSLKGEYRKFVDKFRSFRITRILSEDRGAALEGIVATVYPELITGSYGKAGCGDIYPCFGSWHNVPGGKREDYREVFRLFLDLIEAGITGAETSETRRAFLTKLNSGRFLKREDPRKNDIGTLVRRGLKIEKAEETSAHVIQIYFPEAVTVNLIGQICKAPD